MNPYAKIRKAMRDKQKRDRKETVLRRKYGVQWWKADKTIQHRGEQKAKN